MISYRFEAKGESNPFSFTSFKNCWSTCWDGLVNKLASGWLQGIQSKNSKNWRHGESVALQVEFSSTQMPTSPEARCCDGRASEMFREKHCVRLQAWHKSNLRTADFANLIFLESQISSAKWHKWDFGFIVPDVKEPLRTPTPVRTPPPPRKSVGVAQHLAAFSSWTSIQRTESITMVSVLYICISITVMKVLSQILNWWESFRNSIKNEEFPASLWCRKSACCRRKGGDKAKDPKSQQGWDFSTLLFGIMQCKMRSSWD